MLRSKLQISCTAATVPPLISTMLLNLIQQNWPKLHTPNEILTTTNPSKSKRIYHIVSSNLDKPPKRIDAEQKLLKKELSEASPTESPVEVSGSSRIASVIQQLTLEKIVWPDISLVRTHRNHWKTDYKTDKSAQRLVALTRVSLPNLYWTVFWTKPRRFRYLVHKCDKPVMCP